MTLPLDVKRRFSGLTSERHQPKERECKVRKYRERENNMQER
jgi:hypothetical protein